MKWSIATLLSRAILAFLFFCTAVDFDIQIFFNEDTAGILGNT